MQDLWNKVESAWNDAYWGCKPEPMHVVGCAEPVEDGLCGWGMVTVPGNTAFGRWVKKTKGGRTHSYIGGTILPLPHPTQSYERVRAGIQAARKVLSEQGIKTKMQLGLD